MPFKSQLVFQTNIIFNNSVMDNRYALPGNMRMCILFIHTAMCRPPRMPNAYMTWLRSVF